MIEQAIASAVAFVFMAQWQVDAPADSAPIAGFVVELTNEVTGECRTKVIDSPLVSRTCIRDVPDQPHTISVRSFDNQEPPNYSAPVAASAVRPFLIGDLNNDRKVNTLDLALLRSNFGSGPFLNLADQNCDGAVNVQDVAIMRASFFSKASP